jgi:rubrerythrin
MLQAIGMAALCGSLGLPFVEPASAAVLYPESVAALRKGVIAETRAHRRYVAFGQHAQDEGYKGLAYLYTALATSELIHAQNYVRVLLGLGMASSDPETEPPPLRSAKDNLIYAAERELRSIEKTYPDLLKTVEAENYAAAVSAVEYSWASHRQHLDIIQKIRRWSPSFFESVARKIDEGTDRYFVCQVCGSTVTEMPEASCPVCGEVVSVYRRIPPDSFF